jgi:L-2-hydroxycarboxylate dehydrogenase (NAD+)
MNMVVEERRYPVDVLHRFVVDVLMTLAVPPDDARMAADALIRADVMGIDSHGVARLAGHPSYAPGLRRGLINPTPRPRIITEKASSVLFDGDNGLGVVVATQAMHVAIAKARQAGAGVVAVTNSHHFGIAAHYSLLAVEHDMIGLAMTNSYPQVVPTFGRKAMLGTNPISLAAPAGDEMPFVLDMATSVVAAGKVEIAQRAGKPIPPGWIVDCDGVPSVEAGDLWNGGALLPLGSTPEMASYKGYGLATAVDILCGVLSGAGYSSILDPSSWTTGHFMMAIDIAAFRQVPAFKAMMDAMILSLRQAETTMGQDRVLIHGEREYAIQADRNRRGIPLHPTVESSLRVLSEEIGVEFSYPG